MDHSRFIWTTSIRSQPTEPLPVSLILCLYLKTDCMQGSLWIPALSGGQACWFNHILLDLHTHAHTHKCTHLLWFASHVCAKADSSSCLVFSLVLLVSLQAAVGGGRPCMCVCVCVCVCGPGAAASLFPPVGPWVCVHAYFHSWCISGLKWLLSGAGQFRDGPDCFWALTAAVSVPAA